MESGNIAILADGPESSNQSLTKRYRTAVGWNASSSLLGQGITFLRSIIIARLLVPDDFGLFAMALTVMVGLNALTTIGLDRMIVAGQFKSQTEFNDHLNTVWSAELVRSLFLTLLLLLAAYPTAKFFGQPRLAGLIGILCLTPLIEGFQNIGLTILRKQISFARIFWYELTVNVAAVALTVCLAIALRNVWALIFGHLITALLGTALSYFFHPYRPRLAFETAALRQAIGFGKFALIIAVASYVTTMADNIVVGRVLGAAALGYYSLAYNLASVPIAVCVNAVSKVTLPAFAELALPDSERLQSAFTKVFTISALMLVTITAPLCLLASDIVQVLYGAKWQTTGEVLWVISLMVPFRGLLIVITIVFFSLNKPKPVATGKALEALMFLLLLYPLTKAMGLKGAALAAVLSYVFALGNRLFLLRRVIPKLWGKLVRIILAVFAACGAGLLVGWLVLSFLDSTMLRILLGGFLASAIPPLLLLSTQADLRKWIVDAVH